MEIVTFICLSSLHENKETVEIMKGTTHTILDEKRPLQKLRNGWDENMKIDLVVSEVICENKSCMKVAKVCVRR
jgi:hypothetical protein